MSFSNDFCKETSLILNKLNFQSIEKVAEKLANVRSNKGRLFILGVGGSAGSASHATNDFRKLCSMETYCPTDNVSELTARSNDEGFETVFEEYLKTSKLNHNDAILIFSVGGGNLEKGVSENLVRAIQYAKRAGSSILGIVGRDGGFTAQNADECIIIPTVNPNHITPHTEAFHGIIWHLLASHPLLKTNQTKWESVH